MRTMSQGVTITATKNDSIMAADALAGIGAIYGPIKPETNNIGSNAATTVSVAMMVGFPTSATASMADVVRLRPSFMAQ